MIILPEANDYLTHTDEDIGGPITAAEQAEGAAPDEPMSRGTSLAVAGLLALIDSLTVRMAAAQQAGDYQLYDELRFNIEQLHAAIADQKHQHLDRNFRECGRRLGELMHASVNDDFWAAMSREVEDERNALAASVAADDEAEEAELKLIHAYERIAALEKLVAALPAKRTKRTKAKKGGAS